MIAPELPEGITLDELSEDARRELRSLPKELADKVGIHVVAVGYWLDEDPVKALEHARFARKKASRVATIREANGLAAYRAGEWSEALSELRAARRIAGDPSHLAVMADCERALGRPERALELIRTTLSDPTLTDRITQPEKVELKIVAAGARRDLGEFEAAVVSLQIPELDPEQDHAFSARLFYAYADNLLAAGRAEEAFTWFVHSAHADDDAETDAAERLDELFSRMSAESQENASGEPGESGAPDTQDSVPDDSRSENSTREDSSAEES